MTIRHLWSITCDRSGEDGVYCSSIGADEAMYAEEGAKANGWTGGDGWHECPRHMRQPATSSPAKQPPSR